MLSLKKNPMETINVSKHVIVSCLALPALITTRYTTQGMFFSVMSVKLLAMSKTSKKSCRA